MVVSMDIKLNSRSFLRGDIPSGFCGMPQESPLEMKTQNLHGPFLGWQAIGWPSLLTVVSRILILAMTVAVTAYGTREMIQIVSHDKITLLQGLMIFFFSLNLLWISFSTSTALVGFFTGGKKKSDISSLKTDAKTALLMPVYNEDPLKTTAALKAMAEELDKQGAAGMFEIVMISDSTNVNSWIAETQAADYLRQQLQNVMPVWYRRRWKNTARKPGNVGEFVRRWGGRYKYMVVLDADSIMSAQALITLVQRMEEDKQIGILQTVPKIYGHLNLFSRMQQFAGAIYGGLSSDGLAAWSGNEGNYWGHNAIIRISSFAQSCGLPTLPGKKPFGGFILSHDFIEAALIRRAGWKVKVATDIEGSWEEGPPSMIDVAIRDRRWIQGNLQHIKIIGASGLKITTRLHLLLGIMNYISSFIWLMLLVVGFALSVQAAFFRPEYFTSDFQLFPYWPQFDAERMAYLFIFTMSVLFLPKVLGLIKAIFSDTCRKNCGGAIRIVVGMILETVLSALYAPLLMLIHTKHILNILKGRDSGWKAQRRDLDKCFWKECWKIHRSHVVIGILMSLIALKISGILFLWLLPITGSLLLSVFLTKISGSALIGRALLFVGLFKTPEETKRPPVIQRRDDNIAEIKAAASGWFGGLRFLVENESARRVHIQENLPRPVEKRGEVNPSQLTAEYKAKNADNLEELLTWLDPQEAMQIAGDPKLLASVATLDEKKRELQQETKQVGGRLQRAQEKSVRSEEFEAVRLIN
jgi:membrane glycosyltransferase